MNFLQDPNRSVILSDLPRSNRKLTQRLMKFSRQRRTRRRRCNPYATETYLYYVTIIFLDDYLFMRGEGLATRAPSVKPVLRLHTQAASSALGLMSARQVGTKYDKCHFRPGITYSSWVSPTTR